jgi:DNA-binding NtrC family response regulator
VIVEQGSSSLHVFAPGSTVLVGSGDTAQIRLRDDGVAPVHARFVVRGLEVTVEDLSGESATMVNGEALSGPCALVAGDTVGIGAAALVFHREHHGARRSIVLRDPDLRDRLVVETERALRYQRPLAVVAIDLGDEVGDAGAIVEAVNSALRIVDVAGWDGPAGLVAVLPETAHAADVPVRRILGALERVAPRARAGLALCPADGCTADALLTAARNAARGARGHRLIWHGQTTDPMRVGERVVVAADPSMKRLFSLVERLAPSDLPVLLAGETGTGKEIAAVALHTWSARRRHRLVSINCAAIADSLFESELLGHERGAFSGAYTAKVGLVETAHRGTMFLDEVGDLSLAVQAKLLRVLETRSVVRVGGTVERPADVRVVAASNRNLADDVASGRFRRDLYFRLSAATIVVPPLRSRPLDLQPLARTFLHEACERLGRSSMTLSDAVLLRLAEYQWPGNVRELRHVMDYLAATVSGLVVAIEHLPAPLGDVEGAAWPAQAAGGLPAASVPPQELRNLYEEIRELERTRILQALEAAGGVRIKAAALIGVPLRTFVTKLKEHGIGTTRPPRAG